MHIKLSSSKSVQLGALLCGCLSLGSALAQALSLDALYQMALDRDPSVKAERASELASYERLVQAQAQRLPQVIFSQERQNNTLDMVGRQDIGSWLEGPGAAIPWIWSVDKTSTLAPIGPC